VKIVFCSYFHQKWIDLRQSNNKIINGPFYTYCRVHFTSRNASFGDICHQLSWSAACHSGQLAVHLLVTLCYCGRRRLAKHVPEHDRTLKGVQSPVTSSIRSSLSLYNDSAVEKNRYTSFLQSSTTELRFDPACLLMSVSVRR